MIEEEIEEEVYYEDTPLKVIQDVIGLGFWINPVTTLPDGALRTYTEDVGFAGRGVKHFYFEFLYYPNDNEIEIFGWLKTKAENPKRVFKQLKVNKSFYLDHPGNEQGTLNLILMNEVKEALAHYGFIPTWVHILDVPGV